MIHPWKPPKYKIYYESVFTSLFLKVHIDFAYMRQTSLNIVTISIIKLAFFLTCSLLQWFFLSVINIDVVSHSSLNIFIEN